ncbi:MAG: 16S rRNA (guanine(966)-N(2))-methyltransferase RsmD [Candidatus Acidiferrales bacterium]
MRVVAGKFGGRNLATLRGLKLRPTSDRLREALFNILGPVVKDSVFLDLFAGTGAVGIEALSRGARQAIFVEFHAAAVTLIRKNLKSLGIAAGAEIIPADAGRALERLESRRTHVDLVYVDPPYAEIQAYDETLDFLGAANLLAPRGFVVAEHASRRALAERFGELERVRVVNQRDSALSFYRLALVA